jgi:PKD repeat protein
MGTRTGIGRRLAAALAAVTATGATLAVGTTSASAVSTPQDRIVSADPANWTPHVLDGHVNSVAQIGDTIYLGGEFTRVRENESTTELDRTHLMAFDATDGRILDFAPVLDDEVKAIVPAADGESLYVGGRFTTVNGERRARLVRLDATTGEAVAGFRTPALTGVVKDLRLVGDRLWVGGAFTHVDGVPQLGLATVDAATGAHDPYMGLRLEGTHAGGYTGITKFDVTPDGSRLVAIGNFTHVDGLSRRQAVVLDLTGPAAAVADWQTGFYTSTCSSSFDSYLRDLDISPDGTYVVISTTGAYAGGPPKSCDTTARFELDVTGSGLQPTWVNYTGGDTTYAVAVTGTAVYVGGHFRYQNNPFAADRPGPGAVAREGLAALDPATGLPFSWNPGRDKGVGVFDLLATDDGLWVASDTERIGRWELHGRIAFFPLAHGTAGLPAATGDLPGTAFQLGADGDEVVARAFDGTTVAATASVDGGGVDWSRARGAVMIGDTLYVGWADGTFLARSFDGSTFGDATPVDTADQLVADDAWHAEVRALTGLAFDGGRLYYTLAGSPSLYYRWFNPESGVVGAQRFVASNGVAGLDLADARGMFLAGAHLYVADDDGSLRRVAFADGQPVPGTVEIVGGPGVDGTDWSAAGLFLFTGEPVLPVPNQPPAAAFTEVCDGLGCVFAAGTSSDPEGELAAYEWDFGDAATAAGVTAAHTYAAAGTYTVTLTVTDAAGATARASRPVTVEAPVEPPPAEPPPAAEISFVAATSTSANAVTHEITVPASVAPGDALVLFASTNAPELGLSAPTGGPAWEALGAAETRSLRTEVHWAIADASSAGSTVTVTTGGWAKVDLTLVAYRGAGLEPLAVHGAAESARSTAHTTPAATVTAPGAWVLSYWAHKDSTTTGLDADGATERTAAVGDGGGHVAVLAADSGGPVPAGAAGGLTATATGASAHATMWTIVLGAS